jgi:hypothetical protein
MFLNKATLDNCYRLETYRSASSISANFVVTLSPSAIFLKSAPIKASENTRERRLVIGYKLVCPRFPYFRLSSDSFRRAILEWDHHHSDLL